MRFRILKVRNLICVICVAIFIVILCKLNSRDRFSEPEFLLPAGKTSDPITDVTVTGDWYPSAADRAKFGSADTWREPERNGSASALTGLTGDYKDVVDPIALRTFYMLKTGANVMWERLPVHFASTFRRFPFHQTYSDEAATIGKESVIDILADLPQSLLDDPQLVGYRVREDNVQQNWGWDSNKIRLDADHEGWETDKFKNIPMLLHAFRHAPKHCDWFVFADDDSYIMSHSLGSLVRDLDPKKPYYLGSPAVIEGHSANIGKVGAALKAAKPDNEDVQLFFAHGGSGIILSRGALDALFWDPQREDDTVAKYSRQAIHECCGDAMVAFVLREELELYLNDGVDKRHFFNDPFQGNTLADTSIPGPSGGWCQRIVSWHHLKAWEIHKLYEWETSILSRKPNLERGVLYSDVYHDFILPYIVEEREGWNIFPDATDPFGPDNSYEDPETEEILWPGRSKEHCRRVCEVITHCLGWRYESQNCRLQGLGVTRGIALNNYSKDRESRILPVTSGWDVDKIRHIRSGEECDPLQYDLDTGEYSDTLENSEGWYLRRLEQEKKSGLHMLGTGFPQNIARQI